VIGSTWEPRRENGLPNCGQGLERKLLSPPTNRSQSARGGQIQNIPVYSGTEAVIMALAKAEA
jgi:hypothetical protein